MKVLEYTFDELTAQVNARYGRGAYHAAAIYREMFKLGNPTPWSASEFTQSRDLARTIETDSSKTIPVVVAREEAGKLTKIVFRLQDAFEVESVIVPMTNHATLCISCQVGCRMGCRFCETAQMGFKRNLTVEEIVAQVWTVKALMGLNIRNVVFMGMGEPLDNFSNVVQAIRVLSDQRGLDIAKRHITLSTAGIVDGLKHLAALNWPKLKLAISLNAASDQIRSRIMPVNRRYPLAILQEALMKYPLRKKGALFIEYVLIPGLNDSRQDARQLVRYMRPLKAKLNLIPHNPRRDSPFAAPTEEGIAQFHAFLIQEGVFVRQRTAKGQEIMAACGQLGNHRQYARDGSLPGALP